MGRSESISRGEGGLQIYALLEQLFTYFTYRRVKLVEDIIKQVFT